MTLRRLLPVGRLMMHLTKRYARNPAGKASHGSLMPMAMFIFLMR